MGRPAARDPWLSQAAPSGQNRTGKRLSIRTGSSFKPDFQVAGPLPGNMAAWVHYQPTSPGRAAWTPSSSKDRN